MFALKLLGTLSIISIFFGCGAKVAEEPFDSLPRDYPAQCPVGSSVERDAAASKKNQVIAFSDAHGNQWHRHVLQETVPGDRTLLLVVDQLQQSEEAVFLPQLVRLRRSFAASEKALLELAIKDASQPNPARDSFEPLTISKNSVWPIERGWTAAIERDYSQWVQENASADMLLGSGILVDCAEMATVIRWIYAREHRLPMGGTLSGSGKFWGSWQSTTEWDKLPTARDWKQDRRFKAALKYMLDNTYTHAIIKDLYPVKVDKEFITGGTVYLTLYSSSGHTRTIFNVGPSRLCEGSSCISVVYGSLPAEEYGYESTLTPYSVPQEYGGLMRFRWPEKDGTGAWKMRALAAMPGYSLEQYQWSTGEYTNQIAERLGLWESLEERYASVGAGLAASLTTRLQVTERGYFLCSLVQCAPSDSIYNDWSTPERDSVFGSQLQAFQATLGKVNPSHYLVRTFDAEHGGAFFPGAPFSALDVLKGNLSTRFSSDPRDDFFTRWGISSLGTEARLTALTAVAYKTWLWRDELVQKAQDLCYPGGSAESTCNPNQDSVKKLDTSRLDQAFEKLQMEFSVLLQAANSEVRARTEQQLRSQFTGAKFCEVAECGQACSMYFFMVQAPDHLKNMSSKAGDSRAQRYGFGAGRSEGTRSAQ